jgi:hypothetical protein
MVKSYCYCRYSTSWKKLDRTKYDFTPYILTCHTLFYIQDVLRVTEKAITLICFKCCTKIQGNSIYKISIYLIYRVYLKCVS